MKQLGSTFKQFSNPSPKASNRVSTFSFVITVLSLSVTSEGQSDQFGFVSNGAQCIALTIAAGFAIVGSFLVTSQARSAEADRHIIIFSRTRVWAALALLVTNR